MRIAVIGSNGQLGTDLMKALQDGHDAIGFTHENLEVSDYNSCLKLKEHHPDVIINTAAFHKTDQCEDDLVKTFSVNTIGARNVTAISKEIGAITVLISTDYVFDGNKKKPYTENDPTSPINSYGISKLAGELYTEQNPKHYIARVASLFGTAGASGKGGNFVETMITKAKNNEVISVVDDMWMSPTYTRDAASMLKKIMEMKLPFGTYHVANQGYCTWLEFAEEIFKIMGLNTTLQPIKTRQLQGKASRPEFSALENAGLSRHGLHMREWRTALNEYLIEKGHEISASRPKGN
jgi:dTDP-4-dehydrorhamnose reductase